MTNYLSASQVAHLLGENQVEYCIIGAYSAAFWSGISKQLEEEDVDVVVFKDHYSRAIDLLVSRFSLTQESAKHGGAQLKDSGKTVVDVLTPKPPLYDETLYRNRVQKELDGVKCYLPTVELAAAMKFRLMHQPDRPEVKRWKDAGDFVRIVKKNIAQGIDFAKLEDFGKLVGADMLRKSIELLLKDED